MTRVTMRYRYTVETGGGGNINGKTIEGCKHSAANAGFSRYIIRDRYSGRIVEYVQPKVGNR